MIAANSAERNALHLHNSTKRQLQYRNAGSRLFKSLPDTDPHLNMLTGLTSPKCVIYTSFIALKSPYDFKYTLSFTILLKSDPAASSTAAIFLRVWA